MSLIELGLCPSCGLPPENGRCRECGAVYDGKSWRWERMVEGRKAKRENYIECPKCSEDAGEVVLHHKSLIKKSEDMFDEGETQCPNGHPLKIPAL